MNLFPKNIKQPVYSNVYLVAFQKLINSYLKMNVQSCSARIREEALGQTITSA